MGELSNKLSRRRFARARRYGARSLVAPRWSQCSSKAYSKVLSRISLDAFLEVPSARRG